jgi:hypothetical protein
MSYGTAETKLMKRSNNLVTIWTLAEGVNSSWWAVFAIPRGVSLALLFSRGFIGGKKATTQLRINRERA